MTSRRELPCAAAAAVGAISALPKASAILTSSPHCPSSARYRNSLGPLRYPPTSSAPDRASLIYAYAYAQKEAHSELLICLYTQSSRP